MTGSNAAAIVTPIVAMISLAFWLGLVFYAGSHPFWRGQQPPRRELDSSRQPGTLPPQDRPGLADPAGQAPGVRHAAHR